MNEDGERTRMTNPDDSTEVAALIAQSMSGAHAVAARAFLEGLGMTDPDGRLSSLLDKTSRNSDEVAATHIPALAWALKSAAAHQQQRPHGRRTMVATMRRWFRKGGTVEGLPSMEDLYTAYRKAKIKALLVRIAPYGAGVAVIGVLIVYRQHRARG